MMILKMYIGKLLVDSYELDFTDMQTVHERSTYLKNIAEQIYWSHYDKIKQCFTDPVFYVDVQSKMNKPLFENDLDGMAWTDVRMHYKLEMINE